MPTIAERSVSILLKAIRTRHPSPNEDAPASAVTPSELAMDYRCHTFEVLGFPKFVRQVLLQGNPYSRDYPACPYFFKASDRVLHGTLTNPESWYACGLDGDT